MKEAERAKIVDETIQALVDLVMSQKFADMPRWIDVDLTVSQLRAVYLLAYRGELTITELAKKLGLGKPAASSLVQQLVERGLADRVSDTRDRRRAYVHLTELGTGLVSERREQRQSKAQVWLGNLDVDDLIGLRDGLRALIRAIQAGEGDGDKAHMRSE